MRLARRTHALCAIAYSHVDSDVQIGVGLHGAFIIDPKTPDADPPDVDEVLMLNEWRFVDGKTYASMPMSGTRLPSSFCNAAVSRRASSVFTGSGDQDLRRKGILAGEIDLIYFSGAGK